MNFAAFVLVSAVALWALLGLGGICCRIIGYRAGTWIETVGIGLAGLITAGGVFNLCRVSYGPVYDGLLMAGMIAGLCFVPRKVSDALSPTRIWYYAVSTLLIFGALWLIGHAELPPSAYSDHDDFEKYFVHPLRMLQTGTVFGSPLSAIGTETLGGQAVLHGIVAHLFGTPWLFVVDALFALLLCLLMVQAACSDQQWRLPLVLFGLVTVCVINPIMINVSSIYTTCTLVMTAFLVCCSLSRGMAECRNKSSLPLLLGMLFAALLSLKSINAVYLLSLFTVAGVVQGVGRNGNVIGPSQGLQVCATGVSTALFSLPWLLLHSPHYLASASSSVINGDRFVPLEGPNPEALDLFSFSPLFYGSSYAHYSLLTLIVIFYCIGFYQLSRRRDVARKKYWGWLLACGVALPITALLIIALGPLLNGYETNVRYTVPFLIAGSSMLLAVAMGEVGTTHDRTTILWCAGMCMCGVCVIGLYSKEFVVRVRQASHFGNSLSFRSTATDPAYLAYTHEVLYGAGEQKMRKIQGSVPVGASILVWVRTPYHLDFTRNRIYDVEQAGVGNPWSYIPRTDYVIYQYAGYAMPSQELLYYDLHHPGRRERQVGRNALAVISAIEDLWNVAPELYDDGEVAVFKVPEK